MSLNLLTSKSNNSTITYLIQGLRQMPSSLSNISRLIPPTRDPRSQCFCRCRPLSDSWSELCTTCLSPLDHEQQAGSNSPPTTTLTDLPEALPTLFLASSQEKKSLCSFLRQALPLHAGFHISSSQGFCSHSNVSPIPRYPFFILHTYLLQKYLPDFL